MFDEIITNLETLFRLIFHKNSVSYLISLITIIAVIVSLRIVRWFLADLTKRAIRPKKGSDDYELKLIHSQTLLPLVLSVERYTIYFIALVIILKELGVDTTAILASAGVLGLAVGFGAQNTVKDFISGFFLIFDGLIMVGDVITIDSTTGVVEKVDLRNTMVREFNGRLWTFPNGEVRTFGNFNRDWCRAIAEVGMAYEQQVEEGMMTLKKIAAQWAQEFSDLVVEPPEVQGVMGLNDSSVGLRIVVKVKPMQQWAVERDLRKRIKDQFDKDGVEIPFPRRVVYTRND